MTVTEAQTNSKANVFSHGCALPRAAIAAFCQLIFLRLPIVQMMRNWPPTPVYPEPITKNVKKDWYFQINAQP